jgi:hypothetical protein
MGAVITIWSVADLGGNQYELSVSTSAGASVDDHFACGLDGLPVGDGGVYRIYEIPDATTIRIADDLTFGSPYGLPDSGYAQFYTPTAEGLSQLVDSGPFWAEPLRRDNRVLNAGVISGSGWIYFGDVTVPGGTATNKVYQDTPNDTVLNSVTVSHLTFNATVYACYPLVTVNGVDYTLTQDGSGAFYSGYLRLETL